MQLPPIVPNGLPIIAVVDAVLNRGTNNTFVLSIDLYIMVYTAAYRLCQGEIFYTFMGEIRLQLRQQGFTDAFNEEFKKGFFVAKSQIKGTH